MRAVGSPSSHATPSVDEVYNVLSEIAAAKGEGTVEKRQKLLSDLLKRLDPISNIYKVR